MLVKTVLVSDDELQAAMKLDEKLAQIEIRFIIPLRSNGQAEDSQRCAGAVCGRECEREREGGMAEDLRVTHSVVPRSIGGLDWRRP